MSAEYAPEAFEEIACQMIKDLGLLKQRADTSFLYQNRPSSYFLEEIPSHFGDIPEIMSVFESAKAEIAGKFQVPIEELGKSDSMEMGRLLCSRMADAARNYFSPQIEAKEVEIGRLFVSSGDILSLEKYAEIFLQRGDLTKPNPAWQHHRAFPIKLGENDYTATLVVDPDHQRKTSFILEIPGSQKMSVVLRLNAYETDFRIPPEKHRPKEDLIMQDIYECAEDRVDRFYEMMAKQAAMRERYKGEDLLNLFGVVTKLESGQKPSEDEIGLVKNPAAVYAMHVDKFEFMVENSSLNAMEYAAMVVRSKEELQALYENREKFILAVMKGIIQLFKVVMARGSGGKTSLGDGFDPDVKRLINVPFDDGDDGGMMNAPVEVGSIRQDANQAVLAMQ